MVIPTRPVNSRIYNRVFSIIWILSRKCIVERNCNQEIHVTSYVLRTPKLQRSKIDQIRSPKETPLKLGLEEG